MKSIVRSLVAVLCLAATLPASAHEPNADDRPHRMFTTGALKRAVAGVPVDAAARVDPQTDWSEVRRLAPSAEIIVTAGGMTSRSCRFVSADDAMLTVIDLEGADRPARQIARDDVREIRRWIGRRGSKLGAAIGAGAGAFLGFVSALNLAYRDCGGDCSDEKFLMGLSLVGMPVAGGFAGYYVPKGGRQLQTIYLKR
jgi:hypothetical protein